MAATHTFGVNGINSSGTMNWSTAQNWISGMNANSYLGQSSPIGVFLRLIPPPLLRVVTGCFEVMFILTRENWSTCFPQSWAELPALASQVRITVTMPFLIIFNPESAGRGIAEPTHGVSISVMTRKPLTTSLLIISTFLRCCRATCQYRLSLKQIHGACYSSVWQWLVQ